MSYYFEYIFAHSKEWLDTAVIRDPDAFKAIPEDDVLRLPKIYEHDRWLRHVDDDYIVLAKSRTNKPPGSSASQKIVADIGTYLGMPIPPGVLWQPQKDCLYFLTPLVFSNPESPALSHELFDHTYFPAMAVVDWFIKNIDRRQANIVEDIKTEPIKIGYIDHEHCFQLRKDSARDIIISAEAFLRRHWFSYHGAEKHNEIVTAALDRIPLSPVAQTVMSNILNFPGDALQEIVERIPDACFTLRKNEKSRILRTLQRESLRVYEAFSL